MSQRIARNKVFVSYSHRDSKRLSRLQVHLRPLERDYDIKLWDDTRIAAGALWKKEIDDAVLSCKLAVLIISADFLASDFINKHELSPILDSADEPGGPVVLPVIVSASRFSRMPELSKFQAVNDPRRPLSDLGRGEQEKVWDKVVQKIEDVFLGEKEEAAAKHVRSDRLEPAPAGGGLTYRGFEKPTFETKAPTFLAEFVLNADGRPGRIRTYDTTHYKLRLFIQNAPAEIRTVKYELHETYPEPIREVAKGKRDFEEFLTSYGDFMVNIKLIGDKETNLNGWLSTALHNYYGENPSAEIAAAIKGIEAN